MKKGVTFDYMVDSRLAPAGIFNRMVGLMRREQHRVHKIGRRFRKSATWKRGGQ